MKTNLKFSRAVEPARLAVLIGLAVGLGIAVHESFFVVAGVIAVGAMAVATAHALANHEERTRIAHKHGELPT